jgi:hypothetical protein
MYGMLQQKTGESQRKIVGPKTELYLCQRIKDAETVFFSSLLMVFN